VYVSHHGATGKMATHLEVNVTNVQTGHSKSQVHALVTPRSCYDSAVPPFQCTAAISAVTNISLSQLRTSGEVQHKDPMLIP